MVYVVNCQNHVRNIWNKAIATRMKKRLDDRFSEVKESFPPHLRISFELTNMHRTINKECNGTANYAKGHRGTFQSQVSPLPDPTKYFFLFIKILFYDGHRWVLVEKKIFFYLSHASWDVFDLGIRKSKLYYEKIK